MGTYRAPGQVIDTSLNKINEIVGKNIGTFHTLFAEKKKEQAIQMEKNEAIKKQNDLNRVNQYANWNKNLRRVTPAGGFSADDQAQLEIWAEEFYTLAGKTDAYSLRRMGELLSLPQQIANGVGAMGVINKKYTAAAAISGRGANSIDYINSNHGNLKYMEAYNNVDTRHNIKRYEINGHLWWSLEGQEDIDNNAFVEGAIEGNDFFLINGSIAKSQDAMIKDIKEKQDYKGKKEVDNTSDTEQITYMDYTKSNLEYKETLRNKDQSEVLNNGKYMRSIFPQLVRQLQAAYEKDIAAGGDGGKAGLLLYGKDRLPGGGDDPIISKEGTFDANALVGPWVGSDPEFTDIAEHQKKIALEAFYEYGTQDEFIKKDRVDINIVLKNQTPPTVSNQRRSLGFQDQIKNVEIQKTYKRNQRLAHQIINKYTNKNGKLTKRKDVAYGLLARELNADLSRDHAALGKYIATADGLYWDWTDPTKDPIKKDLDLTSPKSISRLLSVESGGMANSVFVYFQNKMGDDEFLFSDKGATRTHNKVRHKANTQAEFENLQKTAKKGEYIEFKGVTYIKD